MKIISLLLEITLNLAMRTTGTPLSSPMGTTDPAPPGGKLRDRNAKELWALVEDLALYGNESCNDPRYFTKSVKAISFPQNVSSISDRRLVELENQVQHLMEAHLAPEQPVQVNKITSSCEIYSDPHDTQYCMENTEQAFVEYASSHTTIDQSASGKLHDRNVEESRALLEDLALYENKNLNDPKGLYKTGQGKSDRRLVELKNQVQHLIESHLTPKQPVQVNKITSSCEICSGPHDTQYCVANFEQAFIDYASSRTDKAGGK
nr:MAK10-like protein [Tanacetum cinerariifolium]